MFYQIAPFLAFTFKRERYQRNKQRAVHSNTFPTFAKQTVMKNCNNVQVWENVTRTINQAHSNEIYSYSISQYKASIKLSAGEDASTGFNNNTDIQHKHYCLVWTHCAL